ncbi:hypothetical protein ACFXGI_36910 [Streptomyces sp. NPDC059355]|uniref:hypothetical protein n=1 Tax=Streptomyces sp. NPDC059355 TaxID=3346811 RepID=UPI00369714E8
MEAGVPAWTAAPSSANGNGNTVPGPSLAEQPRGSVRVPGRAARDMHDFDGPESLDALEDGTEEDNQDWSANSAAGGFGLYDAQRKAEQW